MFVISQSGEYVCVVIQDVTDWEIHQDVVNAGMPITLDASRSHAFILKMPDSSTKMSIVRHHTNQMCLLPDVITRPIGCF
ncbi:hypothetical protein M8J77_021533 [Diaphorina citri]|nr:hypothetical protein M8J77_021533 [Diaphorina citri]